jgi:hypothetical protein
LALLGELIAVRKQRQRLYDKLDGSLKALFSHCEWRITGHKHGLAELVVAYHTLVIYKRLRNRAETIHNRFQDTVEIKHTGFQLSFPKSTKAFYEPEICWGLKEIVALALDIRRESKLRRLYGTTSCRKSKKLTFPTVKNHYCL